MVWFATQQLSRATALRAERVIHAALTARGLAALGSERFRISPDAAAQLIKATLAMMGVQARDATPPQQADAMIWEARRYTAPQITAARLSLGWSVEDLATACGMCPETIRHRGVSGVRGVGGWPSTVSRICATLEAAGAHLQMEGET